MNDSPPERPEQAAQPRQWSLTDTHLVVDQLIVDAMRRGAFDDLPGYGKPLQGLGDTHDPDWWVKKLVDREQITLLPPGLQLRRDDAALDAVIDQLATEAEVRTSVEEFNQRVVAARYVVLDGPPVITMPRDVDGEVDRWRERRSRRLAQLRAATDRAVTPHGSSEPARPRRSPSRWARLFRRT